MNIEKSPKITIITSTFNCAGALQKTANSIREQKYKNIQWIIADGASKDGTLDCIKANGDLVSNWFSEHDTGIYDAWNKACKLITGDWVIFLGAGDVFCRSDVLSVIEKKLLLIPEEIVIAYGNVVQKRNSKEIYRYGEVDLKAWEIYRPKLPAHQGVFQRAYCFGIKPFDTKYRVVSDSKFLLQSLKTSAAFYLNEDICEMEPGGVSSHPGSTLLVKNEFTRLQSDLGYKVPIIKWLRYIAMANIKHIIYKIYRVIK